ncbi:hypothetical protein ACGFX4_35865 [Kitasatospora sp. NPDC048365]|uniref:hypothetical protein n=1 Tax=Kitasatospora sp. NPDC048365 TaxID=3364050 RepID=UPI0037248658
MTHFLTPLVVLLVIVAFRSMRSGSGGVPSRSKSGAVRRAPVSFDAAAYGLVPREALDPRRSGPPQSEAVLKESQALASTAWGGDWRAAAEHIKAAGTDWDEHWDRFELLRAIAREDDAWLNTWRKADPDDCNAAALEADLMVHRAWAIRGSGYAGEVPAERMAEFRALLPAAIEAGHRAALLAPDNPAPWVVMVTAARGAQFKPDRFQPLWDGLVARAPHHYEGHWQGMQYWCAKWYGSNTQMMEFAERAMDTAPAGSPLAGIYLHALTELQERRSALPAGSEARHRLWAVADALAQVPADNGKVPGLRQLLAYFLGEAGMYEAAVEQFRLIGRWCGASVWSDQGDPIEAFHAARAVAVEKAKLKPLPLEERPIKNLDAAQH